MDMENQREDFGSKIKSVSDEVKKKILDGIHTNLGQHALIQQVIKEKRKVLDKDVEQATNAEIKKKIKEEIKRLYTKEKYKIERIVRTESVNSSARAQLLKYKKNLIKYVKLRTSQDAKVCAKCRTLENTHKTWEIDKLLLLGSYILSSITHPNCRCVFEPLIPDLAKGNDIGDIKNVPEAVAEQIKRLIKEIEVKTPITFVKDPVDTEDFVKHRISYHKRQGMNEDKAKLMADNDKDKFRGKINYIVTGRGKATNVLLSQDSDDIASHPHIVSKIQAQRLWEAKDDKAKEIRRVIN